MVYFRFRATTNMEEFINFAARNYHLFIALAVVIAIIVWTEMRRVTQGYKEITPAEAVLLINKQNAFVLDIRESNERIQGSIIDAKHIALSVLTQNIGGLSADKEKPIIVFCKTGNRSSQASKQLLKNNYTRVFSLKGGINAWINDHLPVTKN